jgi:hypothetical protein
MFVNTRSCLVIQSLTAFSHLPLIVLVIGKIVFFLSLSVRLFVVVLFKNQIVTVLGVHTFNLS